MKLNRILAGMSAAAMAASMLTMITASAADSSNAESSAAGSGLVRVQQHDSYHS